MNFYDRLGFKYPWIFQKILEVMNILLKNSGKTLYLYHRESLFIEKEDKIMVSKEKIENYIKPSPYFHIEEASTKDTYVF